MSFLVLQSQGAHWSHLCSSGMNWRSEEIYGQYLWSANVCHSHVLHLPAVDLQWGSSVPRTFSLDCITRILTPLGSANCGAQLFANFSSPFAPQSAHLSLPGLCFSSRRNFLPISDIFLTSEWSSFSFARFKNTCWFQFRVLFEGSPDVKLEEFRGVNKRWHQFRFPAHGSMVSVLRFVQILLMVAPPAISIPHKLPSTNNSPSSSSSYARLALWFRCESVNKLTNSNKHLFRMAQISFLHQFLFSLWRKCCWSARHTASSPPLKEQPETWDLVLPDGKLSFARKGRKNRTYRLFQWGLHFSGSQWRKLLADQTSWPQPSCLNTSSQSFLHRLHMWDWNRHNRNVSTIIQESTRKHARGAQEEIIFKIQRSTLCSPIQVTVEVGNESQSLVGNVDAVHGRLSGISVDSRFLRQVHVVEVNVLELWFTGSANKMYTKEAEGQKTRKNPAEQTQQCSASLTEERWDASSTAPRCLTPTDSFVAQGSCQVSWKTRNSAVQYLLTNEKCYQQNKWTTSIFTRHSLYDEGTNLQWTDRQLRSALCRRPDGKLHSANRCSETHGALFPSCLRSSCSEVPWRICNGTASSLCDPRPPVHSCLRKAEQNRFPATRTSGELQAFWHLYFETLACRSEIQWRLADGGSRAALSPTWKETKLRLGSEKQFAYHPVPARSCRG